jgi:hypothetical protein
MVVKQSLGTRKINPTYAGIPPYAMQCTRWCGGNIKQSLGTRKKAATQPTRLQFGNTYDQAPLGVLAWWRHQAGLEGRHSQARA